MGEGPARWLERLISSRESFIHNPPLANGGGLFVPVAALRFNQTEPMHHETETSEPEPPAPAERETPAHSRHGLTLLSGIYLEAGLPLDLAIRSAAADCALFEE